MRHPARPHPAPRQAGRRARTARTGAPARRPRLTARGWETAPLPAPDGSGSLVVTLDLRAHEAVVEHSDGRRRRIPLAPNRPVGTVTREVCPAIRGVCGRRKIDMQPQEVAWTEPLDEDELHTPATCPTRWLPTLPPPLRLHSCWRRSGLRTVDDPLRSTRGGGRLTWPRTCSPACPPTRRRTISSSQRHGRPGSRRRVVAWRHPVRKGGVLCVRASRTRRFRVGVPVAGRGPWDDTLGEYILDWDDVIASPDPHDFAVTFASSAFQHACVVCSWDPSLAASAAGSPPPVAVPTGAIPPTATRRYGACERTEPAGGAIGDR